MEKLNELMEKLPELMDKMPDCVKKFLALGDEYLKESDWKDLALIKFCLCAMGILIGLSLPKKCKKVVSVLAVLIFLATYIPLMIKVVKIGMAMYQEEKMFVEE